MFSTLEEESRIKRHISGPQGSLSFGPAWLKDLEQFDYRNYLCRAFVYCELKERYRGEQDPRERRQTLEKLNEAIRGALEPDEPSTQKLRLYFEWHRFPITKTAKKNKSRELQRWVVISTSDFKLHYFKKEKGGIPSSKTYSIYRVKFSKSIKDKKGIMEIQPEERPHGPLTITNTPQYITKLSNNIKCLKNSKTLAGQLDLFLKVYNYSITKRLIERFVAVHQTMRLKLIASKNTVQEIEGMAQTAKKAALTLLDSVLKKAHAEWREFDAIHPPHFLGKEAPSQDALRDKLIQLASQGPFLGLQIGAEQGLNVDNIQVRNVQIVRADWLLQNKDLKRSFQKECKTAERFLQEGRLSFRAALPQRELRSNTNFDLGTIPFGEISAILVNPDPLKSNLVIYGRQRRVQRVALTAKNDPADHGFYQMRKSAADSIDVLKLGLERIVMKGVDNPAAYQYIVHVSVGPRKMQIIEYEHFDGETVLINKTVPLALKEEETILLSLMRRTSHTSRDEQVCFQTQIPFNPNISEQQNEVLTLQKGKFKIFYNYTFHRSLPGNTPTLDSFVAKLTPGSVVGYRNDQTGRYNLGMLIGMSPEGAQVIVEPGVVEQPQKWSWKQKRERHQIVYLDLSQVILESQDYSVPIYWLDEYDSFLSGSVRTEDQDGIASYEWTLELQFTFPVELALALTCIQTQIRNYTNKARDTFYLNLEPFKNIGTQILDQLPLMGHIEVAIFSLTNIQESRYGDKFSIEVCVRRQNQAYISPELKNEELIQALQNMEEWMSGSHEHCETQKADPKVERNRDVVRWDSDFSSHFDLGSFYADLSERKYVYFHLWRRREKKRKRLRTGRILLEDLMSLNRPLQLKYLHLQLSDEEYVKEQNYYAVSSECLYVEFSFYPSEETIERRGLNRGYYDDTMGMIELMRERRRLEPQLTNRYDTVVQLGAYEPNMLNKFFKRKFYEKRDEELLFQYNAVHDVFTLEKEELDLRERVSVEPMLRPPIEAWTFKQRQHRLWEISLQRNSFYTSYGVSKYRALHQKEAQRNLKEAHLSAFMTYRNLQDEGGMDPLLTIDINLQNPENELFATMYSLVKRGIPKHFRFKLWFNLLNCSTLLANLRERLNIEDVYQYFLQKAATHSSNLLELIDYDLAHFEQLPVAPNSVASISHATTLEEMREYSHLAQKSQRVKDIHVKGAIRLILRAYAMYIEYANKQRKKPLIYHRGLIWVVFRLVHGGIVDSLGNAFKLFLGLSNELEVLFQRSEPTLLLNKLETQAAAFSNLCIQDFMLRVQAALDVLYPALSRKIQNLGLPLQYYIGSKFLSFFSDSTLPSQHIYVIWDLAIFYSAVEGTRFVYGNTLLLGIALFFFDNALTTIGQNKLHQLQRPDELKYLIDNPLVLSLDLMNLPTFSDHITTLYESLFPSNILTSFVSSAAAIERRYDQLHAAYRRQFSKYFFHNEATLAHINLTPQNPKTDPLSTKDYLSIQEEVRALQVEYSKPPRLKIKVLDYAIVRRNVEDAFQQALKKKCVFILGARYGSEAAQKLFEMPED